MQNVSDQWIKTLQLIIQIVLKCEILANQYMHVCQQNCLKSAIPISLSLSALPEDNDLSDVPSACQDPKQVFLKEFCL